MTDVTSTVHAERQALVDDLSGLDAAGWTTESLCEGWSIEDVVAHLTQRNVNSPGGLALGILKSGGLQKFIDAGVVTHRRPSPEATLAEFAATATNDVPRTGALQAYLGELVIHAEDIRRPLGIAHTYPAAETGELLRTRGALARDMRRGLRLVATDADVVLGHGPTVYGPAISLLMCLSGRPAHSADLSGAGAEAFAARLAAR